MGWASGSDLMAKVIDAVRDSGLTRPKRIKLYKKLIKAFERHDCDTLQEALDRDGAYDDALQALHPSWFEEDLHGPEGRE